MHTMVRRFIKTGILFLIAGLLLGAWMLVRRELDNIYPSRHLISSHTHLIAVGFVMNMILGVALWLFPRPAKDDTRYKPALVNLAWWLVAGGTLVRAASEFSRDYTTADIVRYLVVWSGAAQALGVVVFFYTMWSRIRGVGSQLREAQGERF